MGNRTSVRGPAGNGPAAGRRLTPKQAAFVAEYLVDLNATQAAVRAGYSAATAAAIGFENLRKPEIAAAIHEAQKARAERAGITADAVLGELRRIGFSDIRKVVGWRTGLIGMVEDPDTGEMAPQSFNDVALVNSADLSDEAAAAIAEVSQTKSGALRVKMHPKLPALVKLGEHLGLFRPAAPSPARQAADPEPAQPAADGWSSLVGTPIQ